MLLGVGCRGWECRPGWRGTEGLQGLPVLGLEKLEGLNYQDRETEALRERAASPGSVSGLRLPLSSLVSSQSSSPEQGITGVGGLRELLPPLIQGVTYGYRTAGNGQWGRCGEGQV